jgi:hypothetical protein
MSSGDRATCRPILYACASATSSLVRRDSGQRASDAFADERDPHRSRTVRARRRNQVERNPYCVRETGRRSPAGDDCLAHGRRGAASTPKPAVRGSTRSVER